METARSAVLYAAWCPASDRSDLAVAHLSKAHCSVAYCKVAADNLSSRLRRKGRRFEPS